ncbi:hypothetical protein HMPREF9443_00188 [Phascolarctobacterium succinatutens YIT 12067]|uniref:Uncharacterized protein n=1 Tax=Phascolarctobacterium succinatutens YIT 12067 TaxID=626939 RepID=E8LBH7_9FIRM|nr:hypothetical protein HMPREF9443_00188 [Phascolarctobacterium succinatutens YIT 12067]
MFYESQVILLYGYISSIYYCTTSTAEKQRLYTRRQAVLCISYKKWYNIYNILVQ